MGSIKAFFNAGSVGSLSIEQSFGTEKYNSKGILNRLLKTVWHLPKVQIQSVPSRLPNKKTLRLGEQGMSKIKQNIHCNKHHLHITGATIHLLYVKDKKHS